jgi:Mg2+-importing ATPase
VLVASAFIPFDSVDDELAKAPQRWNPGDIGRFMIYFGPVSSIFDITTDRVMWFVFCADTSEQQTLFQSGWFIESLMIQTLVVHMIRTRKIPFLQSRPGTPLLVMTITIMACGIFIPMGPVADYFKLLALPTLYFPILAATLFTYMVLTQMMKTF